MVKRLTQADLVFLQAQLGGANPIPGTPPTFIGGIRNVDGTFNNLLHINGFADPLNPFFDQYGDIVNTDTFGVSNQPFIYITDKEVRNFAGADGQTAAALGFPLAQAFAPGQTFGDNYAPSLNVIDTSPRIISNLVVDMSQADETTAIGNPGDPAIFVTPFNSLFTIFGQFVDHGLDFINKGGDGIILIPILPTDPLFPLIPPGAPAFMPVTRASVDAAGNIINSTAPLVDQQQTYGSDQSTRFYLFEYDLNGNATGRLVTNANGGMATWADIKANSAIKALAAGNPAIALTDADIGNIPKITVDPVTGAITVERGALGTGQIWLADIAHTANPFSNAGALLNPDNDAAIGLAPGINVYDNELLDRHFVAGDARVNENVVLSSIHSVFHAEHNRLVTEVQDLIAQRDQIQPGFAAQWTGEMIFEAAKLANEMQYQHIVFEFFARRMSPNITAFAEYNVALNPNITTEFSQAIFRLGHSMLTETVDMTNAADQTVSISLVDAFLNPLAFGATGAADIITGMTQQMGNQIDEFVVDAVRNFLVGLPLDLAAINIARGRDIGLGSLNQVREDLFVQTGGDLATLTGGEASLTPYTSWEDFGAHLLNPDSLVNFIAAYARDGTIAALRNAGNLTGARAAAAAAMLDPAFMIGNPDIFTDGDQGFRDIDLWLGMLAEQKVTGGMLGSTADFIFATQFIALQDADRLYYLNRLGGTQILDQIEGQSLTDLIQRATSATHLNHDAFGTADEFIELSTLGSVNFTKTAAAALENTHEVIGGTNVANIIQGGNGNDTLWGEGGNDNLNGGLANDNILGGDGNDTLTGGDDSDFLRGDAGNDTLHGGVDLDFLFGGTGNDTLNGNNGIDELFGGDGNDLIAGGNDDDALSGGEGNDRLEGGNGIDGLDGGLGNDVLLGGAGVDTLAGGDGDDLLIGGGSGDLMDGGLGGYDIASYVTSVIGLTIDMVGGNPGSIVDAAGDTFLNIEEVRGTNFADTILGDGVNNVLSGLGGIDTLNGSTGNDTLIGGAGNDTLNGGDVAGVLEADTAVFSGAFASYTITATTVTHNGGGIDGTDTITGIEFLRFSDRIVTAAATTVTVPLIQLTSITATPLTAPVLDPLVIGGLAGAGGAGGLGVNGTNSGPVFGSAVNGNTTASGQILDGTALPTVGPGLSGIHVANIRILDPDGVAAAPRAVTLAGADAASFAIVDQLVGGVTVQTLRFIGGGPLSFANYEAQPVYHVTVNVADANGGSSINYTLNITDTNDNRAVITSGASVNVEENTATNVVVYRIAATDADTVGPGLTYSLVAGVGGEDNLDFNIVNGEIRFNVSPNFEAPADGTPANGTPVDNIYNILVGVFDGVGAPTTKAVTIHVTNVAEGGGNTPPTITTTPNNPLLVQENNGTVFYDANFDDPDPLDAPFFLPLTGADAAFFNFIEATGELSFLNAPNFEAPFVGDPTPDNNYTVTISLQSGTDVVTQVVNVTVTNDATEPGEAAPPVFTTTPPAALGTWAENTPATTLLYDADATDPNGTAVILALVPGGADNGFFNFNTTSGELRFNNSPNFEVPFGPAGSDNNYTVTISATSGGQTTLQTVNVTVANVNEPLTITSSPTSPLTPQENIAATTILYTAVAVDPDGTPITFSLTGTDSGFFNLGGSGLTAGQLRFNNSPDFEVPFGPAGSDNNYTVTINATSGGQTVTQTVNIAVQNINGVTIIGSAANDTINGTTSPAGQPTTTNEGDTINGGAGADNMAGLAGNDTYVVDNVADVVTEAADQGIDLVQSSVNFTLSANVENLTLTGAANVSGTGNILANVITGNTGNNIIAGLGGVDTLNGAAGTDTASYAASALGVTASLATGVVGIGGDAQGDTLLNFENLTGSGFNDTLVGNGGSNVLAGGAGIDTVSYTNATAGVTVNLSQQGALQNTVGAGSDTLSGFENLTGSGFVDTLFGDTTANELNGLGGNDLLNGAQGADTLTGGLGNDQFIYNSTLQSNPAIRDTITDFTSGQDDINVSGITQSNGTNAFLFGGNNAAVVARSVTWFFDGTNTIVQGDTTGDTTADLSILLTGNKTLVLGDFIL